MLCGLLAVQQAASFRDVEDLLAERGIVVPYETVRRGEPFWTQDRGRSSQTPAEATYDLASR